MKPNQISPVVITFKLLPGVRLVAVRDADGFMTPCAQCRLHHADGAEACGTEGEYSTTGRSCFHGYHYEQVLA